MNRHQAPAVSQLPDEVKAPKLQKITSTNVPDLKTFPKLPGQIETVTPKKAQGQQHCKIIETNTSPAGNFTINLTITQEMLSSLLQGKTVNININLKNVQ